jgi:PKD repeat protein
MSSLGAVSKGVSAAVLSLLALRLLSATAAPTAGFSMYPDGNPVIGQTVQFTDTSTGGPTTWTWDFGDATGGSNQQNPAHTYAAPGTYQVTLTAGNGSGSTQIVQQVVVTPLDTLQLNNKGDHPFVVKLTATNQHNNNVQGAGQAIPQSDLFGYFSFPSLTNNPSNPEVFIKILDGRPINGQYWVFYGHLTDLIYDLSVTEVATGIVKTYHKDAGAQAPGNADTSGFLPSPSPTPTPAGPTPTQTPTPTPTPGQSTTVNLVASNFQWDFDTGSGSVGESFTFHVGQPYLVKVSRVGGTSHAFSGVASLGWPGSSLTSTLMINFTPTSAQVGNHFFGCTNSGCGSGHNSPAMQGGQVVVAP